MADRVFSQALISDLKLGKWKEIPRKASNGIGPENRECTSIPLNFWNYWVLKNGRLVYCEEKKLRTLGQNCILFVLTF